MQVAWLLHALCEGAVLMLRSSSLLSSADRQVAPRGLQHAAAVSSALTCVTA